MIGLHLRSLTGELERVPDNHKEEPAQTIADPKGRLPHSARAELDDRYGDWDFYDTYHRMPLEWFSDFSFDELCKLKYSSTYMMDESVRKHFETAARHDVVRKIANSMWRWGYSRGTWNEVVDAYEALRRFRFSDNSDFTARLDHATYHNEFGWSKYARTYIDGAFAYLVYYKGVHVLTIGFSIMNGHRLLVQQVQLAKRTGNRWLYAIPKNRLEYTIDRLRESFAGYTFFVIDGASLVDKTVDQYQRTFERLSDDIARYETRCARDPGSEPDAYTVRSHASNLSDRELYKQKIEHLAQDRDRLVAFYRDIGRHTWGRKCVTSNSLRHRQISLAP